MKIVENFKTFNVFKEEADQKFLPKLTETVESSISEKDKKNLKISLLVISVSSIIAIAFLIGMVAGFFNKNINVLALVVSSLIFIIISIILIMVFYYKSTKIKKRIRMEIKKKLNPELMYKEAFETLEKGFTYLGYSDDTNIENPSQLQAFNKCQITEKDIQTFRYNVPYDAHIKARSASKNLLIDNKYPVSLLNILWERVVKVNNKENVEYYNTGILKINTEHLKDRAFDFELLKKKGLFGLTNKGIKLENNEFNKIFNPISKNELKIRQMYTPLAMETSVNRYKDKAGSKIFNFTITSIGKNVYFEYNVDFGFMELNFPNSIKKDKLIKYLYNDFLKDTYSLYYLLSFIYIPLYLY
ncbi:hypothetical protein [Mesomycoplasma lagogenitalium]|uniref:DUF3137 domain-containing protein n=1 Tax=Mesomycoplasma lagogenitalium TaxID=171286 RepID=A0ABY8LU83_9BACT|nr:hypothetical protein [Mesomycoplasma lagogenitalium]WGI36794.1 hypothetical protein QEG99_00700 [Mesomycoplasma lagogenitalium]